jgi:hypothetical protein
MISVNEVHWETHWPPTGRERRSFGVKRHEVAHLYYNVRFRMICNNVFKILNPVMDIANKEDHGTRVTSKR